MIDLMFGNSGSGDVASRMLSHNMDPGAFRPFRSDDPRDPNSYITVNKVQDDGSVKEETLILNAYTPDANIGTLRVREWIQLDNAVLQAARPRLRLVNTLRSRNLEYSIPNGMGRTVLQYQAQTAPGEATVSMDGLRRSKNDRPLYDLRSLPLPIIHEDFSFSLREIMTSRNNGTPLDTTMAMDSAIRVAEMAERMVLGTAGTYAYGGGVIYGLTNIPQRLTYTMSNPTAGGWTGHQTMRDVQAMKQLSMNDFHFGPWMLFMGHEWSEYLDGDYSQAYPNMTLRNRLQQIEGIEGVMTLDFLTGFQAILVEMQPRTIREVIGMDITTLRWPGEGGMEMNFKVMCIMVPQIRFDFYENIGLVHGSVA